MRHPRSRQPRPLTATQLAEVDAWVAKMSPSWLGSVEVGAAAG